MSIKIKSFSSRKQTFKADAVVIGLGSDTTLSPLGVLVDEACEGRIAQMIKSKDITGKQGECVLIDVPENAACPRVLVVGLGDADKRTRKNFIDAANKSIKTLDARPIKKAISLLAEADVLDSDEAWKAHQVAMTAHHATYRYTKHLKKPATAQAKLQSLEVLGLTPKQAEQANELAEGIRFTRELGNLPPSVCNPVYLAKEAQKLAKELTKVKVDVLDDKQMKRLGMNALLAVGQGSSNRPRLVVMKYNGAAAKTKPYVLVGKGVTFDSGGLNIKPGDSMVEMKFDMCGAATVMGTFSAVARMGLKVNLVAIVAAVENMPDGNSYRPSDVLTTMSGQTVEVLNTDAEGRLALCDALTYAQTKFKPNTIVDVATLTGACVIALGGHATGLMTKHDDLADELIDAGLSVHDRAWRLPLWDDYQSDLDSAFADFSNLGKRAGGSISAGCFLSRFTEGQRWAHLDIAGSAWTEGRKGFATGRPVGLLVEWLSRQQ